MDYKIGDRDCKKGGRDCKKGVRDGKMGGQGSCYFINLREKKNNNRYLDI